MTKILLMTSTIAPARDTFLLNHSDAKSRLEDYKEALAFYSVLIKDKIIDKIVYADNSGYDLADIRQIASDVGILDQCEFVSFNTPAVPNVNRYYLEINLVNEAFEKSQFLALDDAVIWKVTGRYIIPNVAEIIQRAPAADLYINFRNRPERTLDFFIVRFTRKAFEKLLFNQVEDFKNIRTGEDILRERLDALQGSDLVIIRRFNETPRVVGKRGYDGARYESRAGYAKYVLRVWANKLLPQVWI